MTLEEIQALMSLSFRDDMWILLLPASLIAMDVFTGVLHAWIENRLKSYRLREGLGKKCGEILVIVLGDLLVVGLCVPKIILTGISIYIIFMEIVSICENLKKLGVPIPKAISNALGAADKAINGANELSPDVRKKIVRAVSDKKKGGGSDERNIRR